VLEDPTKFWSLSYWLISVM